MPNLVSSGPPGRRIQDSGGKFMQIKGFLGLAVILLLGGYAVSVKGAQKQISALSLMPDLPHPLEIRDWAQVARQFDELVFDFNSQGLYLPLIQWDKAWPNVCLDSFFLPSYVGDYRQKVGSQEALTTLGAVLGASLVGVDKSRQEDQNWVLSQNQYFNRGQGENRILNRTRVSARGEPPSWYDLFPAMLFFMLVDQYPQTAALKTPLCTAGESLSMAEMMRATALSYLSELEKWDDQWIEKEPDVLGGVAWLLYMAFQKFGEDEFLKGALQCLERLSAWEQNPFYEVLLPYSAFLAARVNAEQNTFLNVEKLLEWSFGPSKARRGWGVLRDSWGECAVHGLLGSLTDGGGYAFALNTFHLAAALAPLPRYDSRYSRDLGKLLLNLTNNARLFYPGYLPLDQQSSPAWAAESRNVVAYEGLRREKGGKTPYATGDALRLGWAATDYALYGAAQVGFLGALVEKTKHPAILKIDLLALDHFGPQAYPSYLFYNPYGQAKEIELEVGPEPVDLYDTVTKEFLGRGKQGRTNLTLLPKTAAVIVLPPAGGQREYVGNSLLVEGVFVDYGVNQLVVKAPRPGQIVSGIVSLELDLTLSPPFVLEDVQAWLNGEGLLLKPTASGWLWDSTDFPPGEYELLVAAESEDGIIIQDRLVIGIQHGILGRAAAQDLAAWVPLADAPADVELLGKTVTIKHSNPQVREVGLSSPLLDVDLSERPVLVLERVLAQGSWLIRLLFWENETSLEIELKPDSQGSFWHLQDLLGRKTGVGQLQIIIGLDEPEGRLSLFRDGLDLYYQRASEGEEGK